MTTHYSYLFVLIAVDRLIQEVLPLEAEPEKMSLKRKNYSKLIDTRTRKPAMDSGSIQAETHCSGERMMRQVKPWIYWDQYSIYRMTNEDLEWCEDHARKLYEFNLNAGNREMKFHEEASPFDILRRGMIGEFAYFKILKRNPEENMKVLKSIDPGYDDIINGKRIQIKTREFVGRRVQLLVNPRKLEKADYFIGMNIQREKVRCIGYLRREEFKRKAKVEDYITIYAKNPGVWEDDLKYIFHLPFDCNPSFDWENPEW